MSVKIPGGRIKPGVVAEPRDGGDGGGDGRGGVQGAAEGVEGGRGQAQR